ncbi:hypothetical protein [uncultured Nostoc sp.]|uniref:hypothetical protein n=1 Tax=uncultured Nostoc sp. TaxID=340711 RepID=UPI0035CC71B6
MRSYIEAEQREQQHLAKIQVVGQINLLQRLSSDACGGLRLRISVIPLEHQTSRREH